MDGSLSARRGRQRHAGFLPALFAVFTGLATQAAAADELSPFEISFGWSYHGLSVAVSKLKLEQRDAETWVYTSESQPRGIGYLYPERPRMTSVMRVTADGVQPLHYTATAGTSSTRRDIDVTYDWQKMRVTGVYEGSKMDMALKPGTQDDLSVQIAMMVALLRGKTPDTFLLLNKTSVRLHHYTREDAQTIATKIGEVHTIVYRSVAEYSPRATRFWCAPERGYIPMRVQQKKDDSVEWTMQIETFKRSEL